MVVDGATKKFGLLVGKGDCHGLGFDFSGPVSSDNYNSFSGDSYFSRSFWGKSARVFVSFWGGFLLSLVPAFGRRGVAAKGRHQRRAEGYPPGLLNCRRQLPLCCVVLYGSLPGDSRRQIPG